MRSAVLSSPMRLEILLASLGKIIKCLYDLEIGLASLGAIMRRLCCIYELELHLAFLGVIIRCYVVCSYIYDLEILLASLGRIIRCLWLGNGSCFLLVLKGSKTRFYLYAAIITFWLFNYVWWEGGWRFWWCGISAGRWTAMPAKPLVCQAATAGKIIFGLMILSDKNVFTLDFFVCAWVYMKNTKKVFLSS